MNAVRNLKVGKKLILTFSVIFLLLLMASAVFIIHSKQIMNNLTYFYQHPYQVSNTAREIKMEILDTRVAIKDILIVGSLDNADDSLLKIDQTKKLISQNVDVLKAKYLGPASDITAFEEKLQKWQQLCDQALDMVKAGQADAAGKMSASSGSQAATEALNKLDTIISFANGKAASFYNDSYRAHAASELSSILFLLAALLISLLLAWLLTRNITKPINGMIDVILRVENGEQATTVDVGRRTDEFGVLADAFNGMLAYMKSKQEIEELAMTLEHQKSLEQFRVTLMSIGDAVISTDIKGNVVSMNPVAESMTGWTLEEAKGVPIDRIFNIINAHTQIKAENPLQKVLEFGAVVGLANHTVLISKSGVWHHIADSAAPIRDAFGALAGVVLVFRDVSEEYRRQEEIAYISFHDKLTGLYNRAYFDEELKRMNSSRQMPLSVIMGDINGLKLINDAFGHYEGDKYLMAAADALRDNCRAEDMAARWGGDEFVILLPKTSEEACQNIGARITEAYSAISGFMIKPSIALGWATQTDVQQDYQETLKEAETNMYRHKLLDSHSVRNAIVASMDNSMNERSYETEEHEKALVVLCNRMSVPLGLKESDRDALGLLAKLHDIGKIAISDTILLKPGPLDEEEWIDMKKHTEIGYRMAKALNELEHIAEGILSHHERWDGTGYPRGLSGEQIPLNARIIAVADSYDVMTRGRPYRAAISHEEAIEELKRCSGTQFDPHVVDAFLKSLLIQEPEGTAFFDELS